MARGRSKRSRVWAVIALVTSAFLVGVLLPLVWDQGQVESRAQELQKPDPVDAAAPATPPGPRPIAVEWPVGRPLEVLFAGDSITTGSYTTSEGTAFRNVVTDALSAAGPVAPSTAGAFALTTQQVLPDVLDDDNAYDLVVVELGTNDVLDTDLPTFRHQYPAFLSAVRERSPDAVLLCAGVWEDGVPSVVFDVVIRTACEQADGRFVALKPLYDDPANRGPAGELRYDGAVSDDFHPNDAGHAAIADALVSQLALPRT